MSKADVKDTVLHRFCSEVGDFSARLEELLRSIKCRSVREA